MTVLFLAMLIAGGPAAQPAPTQPERPPVIFMDGGMGYRPARPIVALGPVITSAPAPLPRALRPARRASANLFSYISSDDHPARAARQHQDGIVAFRLEVAPTGRVRGCTITGPSGSPDLDRAACRILIRRPRFTPALAADGSAVADSVVGTVRWRLPDPFGRVGLPIAAVPARLLTPNPGAAGDADYPRGAPRFPPRGTGLRVIVGRTGRVIACEVTAGSSSTLLDNAACPLYAAHARFAPARDRAGAAVCDVVLDGVGWGSPRPDLQGRPAVRAPAGTMRGALRAQLRGLHCPGWNPD